MYRILLTLCSIFILNFWSSNAAAAEEDYIGFSIGGSSAQDATLDYGTITGETELGIESVPGYRLESSYKPGININLIFGHRYSNQMRIEGELGYRNNDLENTLVEKSDIFSPRNLGAEGEVQSFSFIFSGYYDVENPSSFTPYLGAGIGVSHIIVDGSVFPGDPEDTFSIDDSDTAFAYQLGTGISYAYSKQVTFDLGYRYFSVPTIKLTDEIGDPFETDYSAHNVSLGLRLAF